MRHIRNLATNKKLQSVYNLLLKTPMCPTWTIVERCKITNPGGIVSEINAQITKWGQRIHCIKVYTKDKKYHFYNLKVSKIII